MARIRVSTAMYNMKAEDVLKFASRYAKLGQAVTEQLIDVLDGELDGINAQAIVLIKRELGGYNRELDEAIAEVLEEFDDDDDSSRGMSSRRRAFQRAACQARSRDRRMPRQRSKQFRFDERARQASRIQTRLSLQRKASRRR